MTTAQRILCYDCKGNGSYISGGTCDTCQGHRFIFAEPCEKCDGVGRKFGLECEKCYGTGFDPLSVRPDESILDFAGAID